MKILISLLLTVSCFGQVVLRNGVKLRDGTRFAARVPAEWQATYNTIEADAVAFSADMDTKWGTAASPGATYAGFKSCADGYLTAQYWNIVHNPASYIDTYVKPFLLSLKNMGFDCVRIQLHYPLFDAAFWTWVAAQGYDTNQLSNATTNYSAIITYAHSIGLGVLAQSQNMEVARGAVWQAKAYMNSLTWAAYKAARAAHISAVHDLSGMAATDPIVIQSEATNEYTHSGQANLIDLAANAAFVQEIMNAVDAAGDHAGGEKYYAGLGVWYGNAATMLTNLYAIANLDGIDLHFYPINNRTVTPFTAYWTTWQTLSASVVGSGKLLMASETDMVKQTDAEAGSASLDPWSVYPRRHFTFWFPSDMLFRWAAVRLGHFYSYSYMSVSWSGELVAGLPYIKTLGCGASCSGDQLDAFYNTEFLAALAGKNVSGLGQYMEKLNRKQWTTPRR